MRGTTSMIRSMGMGLFIGWMEGGMWGIGRTASSMGGVSNTFLMEIRRLESGWRARKSSGLKILQLRIRPDGKSRLLINWEFLISLCNYQFEINCLTFIELLNFHRIA